MHRALLKIHNFRGYFGTSTTACVPMHRGTVSIAHYYPCLVSVIPTPLISLVEQTHSNQGVVLSEESLLDKQGDFIITQSTQHAIGIWTADCLPMFIYAHNTIAVVHIGWRGALNGIISNVLNKMTPNVHPSNMHFFLGPSAQGCCYIIGQELFEAIMEKYPTTKSISTNNISYYFDLKTLIKEQLSDYSGASSSIVIDQRCTLCQPWFYSYRNNTMTPMRQINACWLL